MPRQLSVAVVVFYKLAPKGQLTIDSSHDTRYDSHVNVLGAPEYYKHTTQTVYFPFF